MTLWKTFRSILARPASADPYTPDQAELDMLSALKERFREAEDDSGWRREEWEYNRQFLAGEQISLRSTIEHDTFYVGASEDTQWHVSIENILKPTADAHVGKRTRVIPSFTVQPGSDDIRDWHAAQGAEQFLQHIEQTQALHIKFLRCARIMNWASVGLLLLSWDRDQVPMAACPNLDCGYTTQRRMVGAPCPICEQRAAAMADVTNAAATLQAQMAGQPPPPNAPLTDVPTLGLYHLGDVRVDVADPRDIFFQPGVKEPEDLLYFFERRALPVQVIRAKFPERAEVVSAQTDLYISGRAVSYSSSLPGSASNLKDHAYLYAYHEAASDEYPDGRLVYFTENAVLREFAPHPIYTLTRRLPVYFQWCERDDGQLYGHTWMTDSIPIQRERNRLLTQMRTNRELMNVPRMLVPPGINFDVLDGTPGRLIPMGRIPGMKPEAVPTPSFADYTYTELARMETAVRSRAKVTEQELGRASAKQSGRAAALNEAQASETMKPLLLENTEEWRQLYKAILMVCQAYYSKDRKWCVQGKDKVYSASWEDVDLQNGWDLRLMETDSLSRNPAVRLEQTMGLQAQVGYFTDSRTGMFDKKHFSRVAGIMDTSSEPDSDAAERQYFSTLPERLAQGEQWAPRVRDSAEIGAETLLTWLRGPGRQADEALQAQIEQIYMFYASQLPLGPPRPQDAPLSSGQPMASSAPPGGRPKPGMQSGTSRPTLSAGRPTLAQEAGREIGKADAMAETTAHPGRKHEG